MLLGGHHVDKDKVGRMAALPGQIDDPPEVCSPRGMTASSRHRKEEDALTCEDDTVENRKGAETG
jgi:hypothetical protein